MFGSHVDHRCQHGILRAVRQLGSQLVVFGSHSDRNSKIGRADRIRHHAEVAAPQDRRALRDRSGAAGRQVPYGVPDPAGGAGRLRLLHLTTLFRLGRHRHQTCVGECRQLPQFGGYVANPTVGRLVGDTRNPLQRSGSRSRN